MKKGITLGAIIVLVGGALVFFIGGYGQPEKVPTEPKFAVSPELAYGSASDPTQGLYKVSYWLVQDDLFSYALLPQTATFYWKEKPDLAAVKSVVRIPKFITARKYFFCDDCGIWVETLRPAQPIEKPKDPEEKPVL